MWLFKEALTIAFREESIAQYAVTDGPDGRTFDGVDELRPIPSRSPARQPPLWGASEVEGRKVQKVRPFTRRRPVKAQALVQDRLFA